jgi:chemotaxis protein methyltransferase CheR
MTALGATELDELQSGIAQRLGLHFADDKRAQLAAAAAERMRALGLRGTADYLALLGPQADEPSELAALLIVPETYFLRNVEQFNAFAAIIRARVARGAPVRVLSAGCSTGEEAYSLSIVAHETLGVHGARAVEILGLDIHSAALERARAARYGQWSLRQTPELIRERYFTVEGDRHVVCPAVRERVRFERANLVQDCRKLLEPESFDVVFCRNVLMYFTPEAASQVVETLRQVLRPGGFLFLGHAENLRGLSQGFQLHHAHATFYYERGERSAEDAFGRWTAPSPSLRSLELPPPSSLQPGWDGARWTAEVSRASARIAELTSKPAASPASPLPASGPQPSLQPALELLRNERFADALALLTVRAASAPPDNDALLLEALLRTNHGDPTGAERVCAELLARDELNAGAHYVMALCREQAGDYSAALEHDRTAVYLEPDFAMPHLHLGLMLRRLGQHAAAGREMSVALGLIDREQSSRIVLFGGGFGRDGLRQLCRAELTTVRGVE